jgi:hypothetical protein
MDYSKVKQICSKGVSPNLCDSIAKSQGTKCKCTIKYLEETVMKNQKERTGLYSKYFMEKSNGDPMDPNAEYFPLRVDDGASDSEDLKACRAAIHKYAEVIENTKPQLAADLRERYPVIE